MFRFEWVIDWLFGCSYGKAWYSYCLFFSQNGFTMGNNLKKGNFLHKDTLLMLKVTHMLKWSSNNVYIWASYKLVGHVVQLDWDVAYFLVKIALLQEITKKHEFSFLKTLWRCGKLLISWNDLLSMYRYELIIDGLFIW